VNGAERGGSYIRPNSVKFRCGNRVESGDRRNGVFDTLGFRLYCEWCITRWKGDYDGD